MEKLVIDITTNSSGAFTNADRGHMRHGRKVEKVEFIMGDLASGVDLNISSVGGLTEVILVKADLTASASFYPRTLQHLNTDGSVLTSHCEPIVDGEIVITIAQGGDTKKGSVVLWLN